MESIAEILEAAADLGPGDALARFAGGLEPEWIEAALAATGSASCRRRKMPAERVVWLVLGMAMFADRSIRDVVEHLDLVLPGVRTLASSSVPAARYRLGAAPIEWLFRRTVEAWHDPATTTWRGLHLYAVDGTTLRIPDSDANFERFGKPGGRNGSGDAGYPQVRMAWLMSVSDRLVVDVAFDAFATSEQKLADKLWDAMPGPSMVILDRGFVNYEVLSGTTSPALDRHFLVRMRRDLKVRELEELPDGSVRAEMIRPAAYDGNVPESILGRVIAYQHEGGEPSRLFTTLLDHEQYPAEDIVRVYHERWEIELAFDEFKTHMLERKEAMLRSVRPEGIDQELWGAVLLYNLVRHEINKVATAREVPPARISFRSSLLLMRNFWEVVAWRSRAGNVPKYLSEFHSTLDVLLLPPRRTERRFPRHVKIKMSNYARNRGRRRIAVDQAEGIPK